MTTYNQITRSKIATCDRMDVVNQLFVHDYPLKLEPFVFGVATAQAVNYGGGYWEFYHLSNGGFYMAPESHEKCRMICPNHFEGELSGDALGIVACLTAYSHLSFSGTGEFARTCARHYHLLRDYVAEHPEGKQIYGATD